MIQYWITALLVAVAAVSAIWMLLPAPWQLRLLLRLDRILAAAPAFAGWRARVTRRIAHLTTAGGCGSCAARSIRKPE